MIDTFLNYVQYLYNHAFIAIMFHINRAIRVLTQVRGNVFEAIHECVSLPTVPIPRSFEISIIDATLDESRDALPVVLSGD